jgi:hypothetical protein
MDDYYELLDVPPDAERDDIRTAYRALRDELASGDADQNRAEVAKLNRAWNVLSDPAQRERYDERLAEYNEAGEDDDEYYDDDDDDGEEPARRPVPRGRKSEPLTRAEQRAEARRARANRAPTIELPEGLTMAPTRSRLTALGIDLLLLLILFLATYIGGLKLVDNHFPGVRSHRGDLISDENDAIKKVNADKKRASEAEDKLDAAKVAKDADAEAKARADVAAARAAQKTDQKVVDDLDAEVTKIDKKLTPWDNLVFAAGIFVVLLYTVPSTALTGQTVGKRIRSIRVARLDGSRPGFSTALVRFGTPLLVATFLGVFLKFGLLALAVAVLGMIGWISHPNRQGLHDRLAKTVVVEA